MTLRGSGPATATALIAINVLYGVLSQSVDAAVTAIRQAVTPLRVQGRVVATINFLGLGLTPVGALLGGAAAGRPSGSAQPSPPSACSCRRPA